MKNPDYKGTDAAKDAIKAYLNRRAAEDELFAAAYAKPAKNIDECFRYILNVASKRGRAVCMTDDEVYGLAVHYFDEDDITVPGNVPGARVGTSAPKPAPNVELTDEEKAAAREAARQAYELACIEEERARAEKRRKAEAEKKARARQKQQEQFASSSLFDFADL